MKPRLKRSTIALLCALPLLAAGIAAAVSSSSRPSSGTPEHSIAAAPARAGDALAPATRPVLLTGEVEALDTQTIVVPPSNSSPLVLRNFIAEGSLVKAGDVVLRIETGDAANIDRQKADLDRAVARIEGETAKLEAGAIDTEKAVISAEAALAKAKVDAALPKLQITALNYDRYQAELDRATRDMAIKLETRDNYRQSVVRRREDGELEVKKMQINLAFQIAQLKQSEVRAERDGVVVHGYSPWKSERFEEGSTAWPGNAAGVVQGDGQMAVMAWVLEADRPYLSEGQDLSLRFDALPGAALTGKIKSITSAPEARGSWGNGRYFRVRVSLPENHGLPLVAGMSVFAEPAAATAAGAVAKAGTAAATARKPASAAEPLSIEGEIESRQALPVSPPTIPYVWQYKLANIVPEGTLVNAGQPIAQFESGEVTTQLMQQQGQLNEKRRALEKLLLDQAEAERAGELAVAEARSNAEKAERKAGQPKELIRRVDYDKLVIERTEAAGLAKLALTQREVQSRARLAERSGLQAEVASIQQQLSTLEKGRQALAVLAPRKGLVMYRSNFNGEKFAVGSQVWMGLSVATLADPEQLYINATVPEAQASSVHIGQAARVTVPGANQALSAHVVALGRAFHGKSSAQSTIVRNLELQFDGVPAGLKPGAAVQAVLAADTGNKQASGNKPAARPAGAAP